MCTFQATSLRSVSLVLPKLCLHIRRAGFRILGRFLVLTRCTIFHQLIAAAGIVFIVLFSLITLIQLGYLIKSRTWWLVILLLGGIGEILGWAGRLWSALEVYQLNPFLIQICW